MDSIVHALSHLNGETVLDLLLGISLSAATGFRVFLPLLIVSLGAVLGHLDLPPAFDWAESGEAVVILAIASLIEVVGYYIPFLDATLDLIAAPAAIVAGTWITASLTSGLNPVLQWTLAIIAGGGTAGLTQGLSSIIRALSIAIFAGLTNPVIATIELVLAIAITLLAIAIPAITGVVILLVLGIGMQRVRAALAQKGSVAVDAAALSSESEAQKVQ